MNATQCMGLVLASNRTRGSNMQICLLFGTTASVASLFLRFGRRLLLKVLSKDHRAVLKMPTIAEVQTYKKAFK